MHADTHTHSGGSEAEYRPAPGRPIQGPVPPTGPQPRSPSPPDGVLVCPGSGPTARWREGERLEHIFEDQCDQMRENGLAHRLAVDAGDIVLTYGQVDVRANQLARHLLARGVRPGERVGLLFDDAVHSYVGMLAILKLNAAYVPLDVNFPADRLSYISADAGVRLVLSLAHIRDCTPDVGATLLCVDEEQDYISTRGGSRLTAAEKGRPAGELCYIVYTSGSTGRPKGVAVEHASICNFVRVAAEVYGLKARDRVYQGMTIAFDFSVEETWVPWAVGATLVPKPAGPNLLGPELRDFLQARGVTALCCVPTLLATLDEIPGLRFLLVSGEACPHDLVHRWHRPGRRFLNVYGPTEATVTATWATLHPDRPVTIGVPLPTYFAVILDPDGEKALPIGETGEIGIAGIGLAAGYVNRPDLTGRAFIRDFLQLENNPSSRIYRTGDLGRVNEDGEIEYHGRIDDQVKIRGYRIEPTEIESVLLQVPGVAQAVVAAYEPRPGTVELAAYYSLRKDTPSPDPGVLHEHLRLRLPGYMVPAYFEELAAIPMLPSDKADRKNLPEPRRTRCAAAQRPHVDPATGTEKVLAAALADVLGLDAVSVDSHFFDDLGANSLLLARFCAHVRQQTHLPRVSMKDVYLYPTAQRLAAALDEALAEHTEHTEHTGVGAEHAEHAGVGAEHAEGGAAPLGARPRVPAPRHRAPAAETAPKPAGTARYALCGLLQLLLFLGYAHLGALVLVESFQWTFVGAGFATTYLRAATAAGAAFLVMCAVPIAAKWALIGRWKPREIPLWSLAYVRFWAVKVLVRSSPLALFVGTPLYTLHLRLLGARIGRGVVIFSRAMPVCTDLLTIGAGTVIRKDSFFSCYRAVAGMIQTGPVAIGRDAFVGERTVLDIDTSLGDAAQLGHTSCLHSGQAVPDGQRWHGSPAQPADVDYRTVEPVACTTLRRAVYSSLVLLYPLLVSVPLTISLFEALFLDPLTAHVTERDFASWTFYAFHLTAAFALFFAPLLIALAVVATVPRLLNRALRPGRVYPLYGFHYAVQRAIARMTNRKFFMDLLGDSSYIVRYLQLLGYALSPVKQTGTNFGTELAHETPFHIRIGTGTMISDALSIMSTDFSGTSFRVCPVEIGRDNFLGNGISFPAGARTGDDCLLATKVMIPLGGDVRHGVGLLGSPCFEIPRSVERDSRFDRLATGKEFRRRLAAKNRYNLGTIGLFLLVQWFGFCLATMVMLAGIGLLYAGIGTAAVAPAFLAALVVAVSYSVLVERAAAGFRPLQPRLCSVYDPYFWWHERLWKLLATAPFNGTPFKNVIWRLLGVRIGRRVFDDGCGIPEKTLVAIGDDCVLNAGSVIQCHSLEDGIFKSDHTVLGAGCTLGVEAFVHYGVTMGDGAELAADSFLMKGEEVAAGSRWGGNPASEARAAREPAAPKTHV